MYDGEITGNTMTGSSGANTVQMIGTGTFNMHGGKIHDNSGGAQSVGVGDGFKFNMYNGEIYNCDGENQGIGVYFGSYYGNTAQFTMYGGYIHNNATGVYNYNATFIFNGGWIYNNLTNNVFGTVTGNDGNIGVVPDPLP
jgi:hypothetical protein